MPGCTKSSARSTSTGQSSSSDLAARQELTLPVWLVRMRWGLIVLACFRSTSSNERRTTLMCVALQQNSKLKFGPGH